MPHGVVAAILPFNWPVSVMANKVLPSLLAGNAVVVKAPPTCPATVLLVAAAMADALPPGILSVVNGPDAGLGAALVGHPDVDMVSFTGGVEHRTGRDGDGSPHDPPGGARARRQRPAILAPDVIVDAGLANRLIEAAFVTSGQVCMAVKRLYVHRDRLEATVDALAERVSSELVGDGLVEGVTMGPCIRQRPGTGWRPSSPEAEDAGAAVLRPGQACGPRTSSPAGTSSRPRW